MKPENKALIRARAERAIAGLYHNATPTYPRELYGRTDDDFQSWFEGAAEFEIEYLRDGGSTPGDYRKCLAAPCNAGRYKSERAREYYVRKGMRARDLERADCGMLTGWRVLELAAGNATLARALKKHGAMRRNDAQWERINEYGKLYQYGRGGRTLAPDGLVSMRGGSSFALKEDCSERSIADCLELIRIVESFNRYVESWCADVPNTWREYCADEDAELLRERRMAVARKAKETRERRYWEARDVATAAV